MMLDTGFSNLKTHIWEYLLPAAAFLVAFALRYHFLVTYSYPMMIHEQDAVGYMDVAKSILQLRLPSVAGRPPGYPIVISLFALFPIGLEYAARLASVFMDAMIVVPLFFIARIYLSRAGSFAVCLLWAGFSFSLVFSPSPLSQSSFLCYLLSGVICLQTGLEKKGLWWLFGAGACMALSYLARPEGMVGFGCGFLICLTPFVEKGGINKNNLAMAACFLLGFLLLAAPYLIALHRTFGVWTLSPMSEAHVKTADVILTLNAKGDLQKTGSTGISVWKEHYKTMPLFLGAVWANIQTFAGVYKNTFPTWMLFISGAGVLSLAWKNPWRNFALFLLPIAVIAPNFVVTIPKTHSYLYPVFAMTFICFVSGFETITKGVCRVARLIMPEVRSVILEISLMGILLATVFSIAFEFYLIADNNYKSPEQITEALVTEKIFKGAGEIIKNNSQANDIIMTRWGLVGYFADRPVLTLPKGGVKEVIEYGKKNGARFILIDTKSVLSRRPELRELLGPLEGKLVNPAYGIEAFNGDYFPDLGGYVIYRYK
jgi:hypothetical protein